MQDFQSIGTHSFPALRGTNEIYVDKTDRIFELACQRNKLFLARPKGFGKFLLVSTFESLFKDGLAHFDGLAIAQEWADKTYDVVSLDFSLVTGLVDPETFIQRFEAHLYLRFKACGFEIDEESPVSFLGQLSGWLRSRPNNSLVLLIDEYDAPLNQCLENPALFEEVQSKLSNFYNRIKAAEGALRFMFITGATPFSHVDLFSGLNNLTNLSDDVHFATLCGFTEAELEAHFASYIDKACLRQGLSKSALLDRLERDEEGNAFEAAERWLLFSPRSVLSLLGQSQE